MSTPDEPTLLASALRRVDGVGGATVVLDPPEGSWAIRVDTDRGRGRLASLQAAELAEGERQGSAELRIEWEVGPRPVDGVMTAMLVGTEGTANVIAQRVRDELVWKRS